MVSVLLALAAAISWGVSDFLGGLNSRSVALAAVLLISQIVGLLVVLPLALLRGAPQLDGQTTAFAVVGSISGLIGVAGLYRGMAVGTVSIVAPISATGAVLPVLFGLVRGERASTLQSVGMILAVVGIVLASRAADADDGARADRSKIARGVGLAILAAAGFGGYFILLHEASVRDVTWASVVQRFTGVCCMAIVVLAQRPELLVGWRRLRALVVVGALDVGANVLYAFASVLGLVSLAAVLASLFPVVTVVLARFVLHERLTPSQGGGVVCALAGVAFIAVQ